MHGLGNKLYAGLKPHVMLLRYLDGEPHRCTYKIINEYNFFGILHCSDLVSKVCSTHSNMSSSPNVAIVTGGNSGMGTGIARKLVESGWRVAIADVSENKELEKELGEKASFHKCDVADYDRYVGSGILRRMADGGFKSSEDVPRGMGSERPDRCFVCECRNSG